MKHGPPFIAGKNPAFFGPKNSDMTAFLIYHKFDLPVFMSLRKDGNVGTADCRTLSDCGSVRRQPDGCRCARAERF